MFYFGLGCLNDLEHALLTQDLLPVVVKLKIYVLSLLLDELLQILGNCFLSLLTHFPFLNRTLLIESLLDSLQPLR